MQRLGDDSDKLCVPVYDPKKAIKYYVISQKMTEYIPYY